jgi:hypothetical protein
MRWEPSPNALEKRREGSGVATGEVNSAVDRDENGRSRNFSTPPPFFRRAGYGSHRLTRCKFSLEIWAICGIRGAVSDSDGENDQSGDVQRRRCGVLFSIPLAG